MARCVTVQPEERQGTLIEETGCEIVSYGLLRQGDVKESARNGAERLNGVAWNGEAVDGLSMGSRAGRSRSARPGILELAPVITDTT